MPRIIEKVIHEPVWHKKCLGVSTGDAAPDTLMRVSCDYRKKDGSLFLHGSYLMPVRKIKAYESQKIKGATIHLVPFEDLEKYREDEHEEYKPTPEEGTNLRVADNWKAAEALEKFKQSYVDPFYNRVQELWKYVSTDKYEEECKLAGKEPDPAEKKRHEANYDSVKYKFDRLDEIYKALYIMVQRHENLVTKLSEYEAAAREYLMPDGQVPKDLSMMQRKLLEEMFGFLWDYLKITHNEE